MEPATKQDLKDLLKEFREEFRRGIREAVAAGFGNSKPALEQATTPAALQLLSTDAPASPTTTVDVVPVLAASSASAKPLDMDATGVAAPAPTTCSTDGHGHDTGEYGSVAVSLIPWSTIRAFTASRDTLMTQPCRLFVDLRLDKMAPTTCSAICCDDNMEALAPVFMPEMTPSIMPHGRVLRPEPWPSFIDEHTCTARSDIIEPTLSIATMLGRAVVSCPTLPPLLPARETSPTFSIGSGHAGEICDTRLLSCEHMTLFRFWNDLSEIFLATISINVLQLVGNFSSYPGSVIVILLSTASVFKESPARIVRMMTHPPDSCIGKILGSIPSQDQGSVSSWELWPVPWPLFLLLQTVEQMIRELGFALQEQHKHCIIWEPRPPWSPPMREILHNQVKWCTGSLMGCILRTMLGIFYRRAVMDKGYIICTLVSYPSWVVAQFKTSCHTQLLPVREICDAMSNSETVQLFSCSLLMNWPCELITTWASLGATLKNAVIFVLHKTSSCDGKYLPLHTALESFGSELFPAGEPWSCWQGECYNKLSICGGPTLCQLLICNDFSETTSVTTKSEVIQACVFLSMKKWLSKIQWPQLGTAKYEASFWPERHLIGNYVQVLVTRGSQLQLFLDSSATIFLMEKFPEAGNQLKCDVRIIRLQ